MKKKKITPNRRLTNAYQVVSQYDRLPYFKTYQEELIRIFYSRLKYGRDNTIPVSEASEEQIYSVAKSLFDTSYELLKEKTIEERVIIKNLFLLEQALKQKEDTEALEERVCIQLENYSEDSDLVQEYKTIEKLYK